MESDFLKKYKYQIAVLAAAGLFILAGYFIVPLQDNKLKLYRKFENVHIKKTEYRRGIYMIFYNFKIKNEEYSNYTSLPVNGNVKISEVDKIILNQSLRMAYDSLNPNNSKLLLSMKDYNDFKIEPDSSVVRVFKEIDPYRYGNDR